MLYTITSIVVGMVIVALNAIAFSIHPVLGVVTIGFTLCTDTGRSRVKDMMRILWTGVICGKWALINLNKGDAANILATSNWAVKSEAWVKENGVTVANVVKEKAVSTLDSIKEEMAAAKLAQAQATIKHQADKLNNLNN
jgi:hypothetical protein